VSLIYCVLIGQQSALFSAIKGNIFRAKKEACVNETNACPPQLFDVKPPPHKERYVCASNFCCTVNPQNDNIIFMVGHDATRALSCLRMLKQQNFR
jgi:hypothetical protein